MFIQEAGSGGPELLWSPGQVGAQRLRRRTVLLAEQGELESER